MSGTMNKIKAKVDNVLHKDKTHDTTTGTHGTTGGLGSSTHASDPTGPHNSHAANKADPRVDSDRYGVAGNTSGAGGVGAGQYSSTGTHTGTTGGLGLSHGSDPTGPHNSHAANKADPRVDSDRYGAAGNTSGAGGIGAGQYGSSTGTHHTTGGLTGNSHNNHATSDPTGPHDSKMANKLDPRVDSDRYGAAGNTSGAGGVGSGQYSSTGSGLTGSHATTGSGLTGSHATTGSGLTGSHATTGSGLTGSHATTGSGLTGSHATTGSGLTGSHATTGSSGLTGSHGTHTGATVGSGNSNTTAGPHNSDMLNKIDPRVDSDLNGSKTVGGNKTYQ